MFPPTRGAAVLAGMALWAASLSLQAQGPAGTPSMPDGPGRSLVTMQCANCHALDVALSKRGTTVEWSAIVKTMVERGAPITDADAASIAAYLGQNFGPGAPAPAAAARGGQASALPDLPGRDVLTRRCKQWHQMSMLTPVRHGSQDSDSEIYPHR